MVGPRTSAPTIYYPDYNNRHRILFFGTGLPSNQEVGSYPIMSIPLLHEWEYLTWQANNAVCIIKH